MYVSVRACVCVCVCVCIICKYLYIYKVDVPTDSGILPPELKDMDNGGQQNGVLNGVPSSSSSAPVSTLQPPPLVYRHTDGRDTGAQQGVILAPPIPIPQDTGAQQGDFTGPGARGTYTYNSNGRHKFWKVLLIVTFYSKYIRTLTFQNVCQQWEQEESTSSGPWGDATAALRDAASAAVGGRCR